MIKFSEIKKGDIVNVRFEDSVKTGRVVRADWGEKKVLVAHGDQEFGYNLEDISSIPLTTDILKILGFLPSSDPVLTKDANAYIRGPFVVRYPRNDNDSMLLSFRDEHRKISSNTTLNQFQNHFQDMTNVHL